MLVAPTVRRDLRGRFEFVHSPARRAVMVAAGAAVRMAKNVELNGGEAMQKGVMDLRLVLRSFACRWSLNLLSNTHPNDHKYTSN